MTEKKVPLRAPNGCPIVGTVETLLAMYPVEVWREPDGSVHYEYTGGPSKVYDECAEVMKREPVGGGPAETVFQDEDGDEWLESQLVPERSGWTFQVREGEVDPKDRRAAQLRPGWYAQLAEDADTGTVAGPFGTEAEAEAVLDAADES